MSARIPSRSGVAVSEVAFVTADGVDLVADLWRPAADVDADVALAFTHGFTGSAADPDVHAICTRLVAAGITVLITDLRGHGRSTGLSTAGVREVADVAAAVGWLRTHGHDRIVVGGWSMGGAIALRYAGLGGDADAVLTVSAVGHWYERGTAPMRVVHWVCETATGRLAARVLRGTRLDPRGWPDLPASPLELIGAIPVATPLLLVHGDLDHYLPVSHVQALATEAPHAEVWLEPGMGHAESGTSSQLADRLASWVLAAVGARAEGEPVFCDDVGRD